jgi:hypothetical protein
MTVVVEANPADGVDLDDLVQRVSDAATSWQPDHPEKVFVSSMITPALLCASECDADCESPCHEAHEVPARRQHDPQRCPGVVLHPSWVSPTLDGGWERLDGGWERDVVVTMTSTADPYPQTGITVECLHLPTGLMASASVDRSRDQDDPRGMIALRDEAMAALRQLLLSRA